MRAQGDDQTHVVALPLVQNHRDTPQSRAAGSIGAPRSSVAPLVAVSSLTDSHSAALSSTMVLVIWLVQVWRTDRKNPR
jgi:hypothetical protein